MLKAWQKFILKLNPKIRFKLEIIIEKIINNNFKGLSIQKISGKKSYYKVRVGRIRIIFIKSKNENIIDDIGYRGDIYKGL